MSGNALLANAHYIVFAPLLAFSIIIPFRKFLGLQGAWVGVLAMGYAFIHSTMIGIGILMARSLFQWKDCRAISLKRITFGSPPAVSISPLGRDHRRTSSMMLIVVTLVSLLVQIYSIAYMHDHIRFGRYFVLRQFVYLLHVNPRCGQQHASVLYRLGIGSDFAPIY